ncbi:MAG: hypothetical protein QXD13_00340, partial [Candidatus Pacearchaeota archaeon]
MAIKFALAFCFLFALIPFSSALKFDFASPSIASIKENISISISATTSDVYDVKIMITDATKKIIFSEIYEDKWRNPYQYIQFAFPEKSDFLIRAIKFSENVQVCIRLRKSGSSSYSELCKPIIIIDQEFSQEPSPNSDENEDSFNNIISANSSISFLNRSLNSSSLDFIPLPPSPSSITSSVTKCEMESSNTNEEKIVLNPESDDAKVSISKD